MDDTDKKPALHPKEVETLFRKADHYGMQARIDNDVEDGFTRVIVSGSSLTLFENNASKWTPNARVQGNAGPGKLAFMWSTSKITEPTVIPTKPKGSREDDDVLDMVPEGQILTEGQLTEVLDRVNEGIDEAYPDVTISHPQFGKAKLGLVLLIMDKFYGVSSRSLNRYMSICTLRLLGHLQSAKGGVPENASLPVSPVVLARR